MSWQLGSVAEIPCVGLRFPVFGLLLHLGISAVDQSNAEEYTSHLVELVDILELGMMSTACAPTYELQK
jgi:hypothetical protein